jgi:hypothetical protein
LDCGGVAAERRDKTSGEIIRDKAAGCDKNAEYNCGNNLLHVESLPHHSA